MIVLDVVGLQSAHVTPERATIPEFYVGETGLASIDSSTLAGSHGRVDESAGGILLAFERESVLR